MSEDIDKVQEDFMKGYRSLKMKFGKLESDLKGKDNKISSLSGEVIRLEQELQEVNKGLEIYQDTVKNKEQIFEDYKNRERFGFEMIIKSVVDYMDRYELYRETVNRYAGAVLQAFRGLNKEQKERFTKYITKKTTEVENYAKRLKDGKV